MLTWCQLSFFGAETAPDAQRLLRLVLLGCPMAVDFGMFVKHNILGSVLGRTITQFGGRYVCSLARSFKLATQRLSSPGQAVAGCL